MPKISNIEYNYGEETITFYTKINGYEFPFSVVHKEMEWGEKPSVSTTEILKGMV